VFDYFGFSSGGRSKIDGVQWFKKVIVQTFEAPKWLRSVHLFSFVAHSANTLAEYKLTGVIQSPWLRKSRSCWYKLRFRSTAADIEIKMLQLLESTADSMIEVTWFSLSQIWVDWHQLSSNSIPIAIKSSVISFHMYFLLLLTSSNAKANEMLICSISRGFCDKISFFFNSALSRKSLRQLWVYKS